LLLAHVMRTQAVTVTVSFGKLPKDATGGGWSATPSGRMQYNAHCGSAPGTAAE
jgi:hypothetical protein